MMSRKHPTSTLFPYTTLFRSLEPLPAGVEVAAYRIVVEAVNNVQRHSGAARCTVTLARRDGDLHVEVRSEEHTSELQSRRDLVCRLLLEKTNSNHDPCFPGAA